MTRRQKLARFVVVCADIAITFAVNVGRRVAEELERRRLKRASAMMNGGQK